MNIDAQIENLRSEIATLEAKKRRGYDFYEQIGDRHDDGIRLLGVYTVVDDCDGQTAAIIVNHKVAAAYLKDNPNG